MSIHNSVPVLPGTQTSLSSHLGMICMKELLDRNSMEQLKEQAID
jgi:hypothetical protein